MISFFWFTKDREKGGERGENGHRKDRRRSGVGAEAK